MEKKRKLNVETNHFSPPILEKLKAEVIGQGEASRC